MGSGGAIPLEEAAFSRELKQSSLHHFYPVMMEQSPALCEDLKPGGNFGKKVGQSSETVTDDEGKELRSSIAMRK